MRTYIGYSFFNLPDDERHTFWWALKEAKLPAYEIGNRVLVETDDVVRVDGIFRRVVDHRGGRVVAHCLRLSDSQIAELERRHVAGEEIGPENVLPEGDDAAS